MKYMVRMHDYDGSIIDGEIYSCATKEAAIVRYKARCKALGIAVRDVYYYTVNEYVD